MANKTLLSLEAKLSVDGNLEAFHPISEMAEIGPVCPVGGSRLRSFY